MKTLEEVLLEAQEEKGIDQLRAIIRAERAQTPKVIGLLKAHLLNQNEFELYEFLERCDWWEAKIGHPIPPIWYATGGVRVNSSGVIEFYYDANYLQNKAKEPGNLVAFIAHEASHIFRFHQDRENSTGRDYSTWNVATDMVINHDIEETPQIAGWKPFMEKEAMRLPDKFKKEVKEDRQKYYSEYVYGWLDSNKDELEKATGETEGPPGEPKNYYERGQIVRVKTGPEKGQYGRITKVNDNGTFEIEKVDINEIKEKIKEATGLGSKTRGNPDPSLGGTE